MSGASGLRKHDHSSAGQGGTVTLSSSQTWPSACRAATTANITISTALNSGDTLDGVTLATGDRVLVKDQSTGSQNGIYTVGASPARADDYASSGAIVGSVVIVSEGTANADTAWQCTTNGPITVGTTALVFAAFGGGGTPTLATVLAAGNDPGGAPIKAAIAASGFNIPAYVDIDLSPPGGFDPDGGHVEIAGGFAEDGGSGEGGRVSLYAGGGAVDEGASHWAAGGYIDVKGGQSDGTGGSIFNGGGNALVGSNTAGGDITLHAGTGDGTGRAGLLIIQNAPTADPVITDAIWADGGTLVQSGFTAGGGGSVATDAIFDAKGDLAVGTGADTAAKLTAGANDTILMADSAASTGLKWVASATPSTQAFGDSAATGTGDTFTRGDHKHAMPALGTTAAAIGTSAGGAATTPSKSDHVHATGAGTPSTQALGDSAATGSGPAAAMTDHKHAMPAAAVTTSGLTQATNKLLGRSTASTGAIEEITIGTNLSLSGGVLDASGGGGGAVATDVIWDAKGDLAGGTGANTAAKLTVGTNGYVLTADSAEATGMKWSAAHGCRVTDTTGQSISNNTLTALAFAGAEKYDTDTFHDTATNNTRLTVPSGLGGKYRIGGTVTLASSSTTGARLIGVRVNGSDYVALDERPGIGTSEQYISISTEYVLVPTDYVELIYRQTTGGSVSLSTNANYGCQFWMSLAGA